MRLWPVPLSLVVGFLAGCSTVQIESAHFGPSTDIERAIRLFYERYASEGGARCFRPYIDGFIQFTVLEDAPERLVVHARYFHRDRFQEGGQGEGGQNCVGFNERSFTLTRDESGRPVVVDMTGEQEEPAIRSLIRRLFSN